MNPKRTPWLTLGLAAGNIVIAFLLFVLHPEWSQRYGFDSTKPSFVTAVTCMFLHGNAVHLMGNMLALVAIGAWVEDALGHLRFLLLYLVSGLVGVGLHYFAVRNSTDVLPLIGASGAVAGCTAYASVRYMWSGVPFGPRIKLPVVGVAGVWATLQLVGAFVKIGEASATGFWAHLGGIVAGLIAAAVFGAPQAASLAQGRRFIREKSGESPQAMVQATLAHLKSHPDDVEAWERLAEGQEMLHHPEEEIEARLKVIELGNQVQQADQVVILSDLKALGRIDSLRRFKLSQQLGEHPARLLLLQSLISERNNPERAEALYALAVSDPEETQRCLSILQADYDGDPILDRARAKGLLS